MPTRTKVSRDNAWRRRGGHTQAGVVVVRLTALANDAGCAIVSSRVSPPITPLTPLIALRRNLGVGWPILRREWNQKEREREREGESRSPLARFCRNACKRFPPPFDLLPCPRNHDCPSFVRNPLPRSYASINAPPAGPACAEQTEPRV